MITGLAHHSTGVVFFLVGMNALGLHWSSMDHALSCSYVVIFLPQKISKIVQFNLLFLFCDSMNMFADIKSGKTKNLCFLP